MSKGFTSRARVAAALAFVPFLFGAARVPPAAAHDFWLEPSSLVTTLGEPTGLRLFVGQPGAGEPFPRSSSHMRRFEIIGPNTVLRPLGFDGMDPAGFIRLPEPGLWVVAYESQESTTRLDGESFDRYLAEEGLEEALELRRRKGKLGQPATELFSRSVKALIRVVEPAEGPTAPQEAPILDRPTGLPLELMLESRAAGSVSVRLLADGAPVPGSLLELFSLDGSAPGAKTRTDTAGRALFSLGPGPWLVTAVTLQENEGDQADWKSTWASLAFAHPGY